MILNSGAGVDSQRPKDVRRSVRALLLDDDANLVLLRRVKLNQPPYWTAPGGGIKATDISVVAALERELAEELGAVAVVGSRLLVISSDTGSGVAEQEIFAARLVSMDSAVRCGEEWSDPSRGIYEIVHVPLDEVCGINLKPDALKSYAVDKADELSAIVSG
jgi:ADP-ribose pyrophosphatase YjhB (NUDIX family)